MKPETVLAVLVSAVIIAIGNARAEIIPEINLVSTFVHDDYRFVDDMRKNTAAARSSWHFNKDDVAASLSKASSVSRDFGSWLGDSNTYILITLTLDGSGGMLGNNWMNFLVTVVDPKTNKRMTPVYHFWAHEAQIIHLHAKDHDYPVVIGHLAGQGYWFEDRSIVIRFEPGKVTETSVIGALNPELHQVHREDPKLILLKLEGYYREDPRSFMPDAPLWSRQLLKWDPTAAAFQIEPE